MKILQSIIKNYYKSENKFIQIFLNIITFILSVFMCLCMLKILYVFLGRVYFNIVISIVIISLVITDKKIEVKGKVLFISIILIQFLMYYY